MQTRGKKLRIFAAKRRWESRTAENPFLFPAVSFEAFYGPGPPTGPLRLCRSKEKGRRTRPGALTAHTHILRRYGPPSAIADGPPATTPRIPLFVGNPGISNGGEGPATAGMTAGEAGRGGMTRGADVDRRRDDERTEKERFSPMTARKKTEPRRALSKSLRFIRQHRCHRSCSFCRCPWS